MAKSTSSYTPAAGSYASYNRQVANFGAQLVKGKKLPPGTIVRNDASGNTDKILPTPGRRKGGAKKRRPQPPIIQQ